ncbi:MAG: gamma-glutamyltransferase [Rhodospirillales bacterium]|nr:gamma-glutamyltransferase [Rhodospirillales bacterium]
MTESSQRRRRQFSPRRWPSCRKTATLAAVLALLGPLAACQHEAGTGPSLMLTGQPADGPVTAKRHMIVADHPLAAEAGREILRSGGTAVDAAIAAQMVLTLVEPQSSGIGGGGFLMHFAARTGAVDTYDGREAAPKSAHPYMFLDGIGKPMAGAGVGGLPVGVPGLLRMLELAHKEHGRLKWRELFQPAIKLARDGFPISKRLARQIASAEGLRNSPVAGSYFFDNDGVPKPAGAVLRNRDLAETLAAVAESGADAFHEGAIAEAVARAVGSAPHNPARMTIDDLKAYQAKKRPPLCLPYRMWLVCGFGPPSSGGVATLQILGILQGFDLAALGPESSRAVHLISEAGALAFADREVYVADPDFVPVPADGLLDPQYLALRASQITGAKAGGRRQPGMPGAGAALHPPHATAEAGTSTAHLSVVDADGNAVALTASINRPFGSRLMVRGFLLNDELTDFSFTPNADGAPVANRAGPGKRPRSSMAPTLVFDGRGRVVMAIGSPGGPRIIGYVTKALIAALDWRLDIRQAVAYPNFVNRNGALEIEKDTSLARMVPALKAMGHEVLPISGVSGLNGILVTKDALEGATDPRREGVALGD